MKVAPYWMAMPFLDGDDLTACLADPLGTAGHGHPVVLVPNRLSAAAAPLAYWWQRRICDSLFAKDEAHKNKNL